ncbi:hypothetical protein HK405_001866 [Cladochytrium tenue]|nr:hypothetical protein HK405_001866 [Cladochytrium tenue]
MFDLAIDATSQRLAADVYEAGGVVAAVCHGPAALVNVRLSGGGYLLAGKKATGFSNAEEEVMGLTAAMPFLLETGLKETSGALYEKAAADWAPHVAVDGRVVTGQNPASSAPLAEAVVKVLRA